MVPVWIRGGRLLARQSPRVAIVAASAQVAPGKRAMERRPAWYGRVQWKQPHSRPARALPSGRTALEGSALAGRRHVAYTAFAPASREGAAPIPPFLSAAYWKP